MTFQEAMKYALDMREDVSIMKDKDGDFHVIRAFGVKHWKQPYLENSFVTDIVMVPKITGRKK